MKTAPSIGIRCSAPSNCTEGSELFVRQSWHVLELICDGRKVADLRDREEC